METNASAPTVKLQRIRLFMAVIGCRKWNIRAMGVSRDFPRPGPLKRDNYSKLPDWGAKGQCSAEAAKTTVWVEYRL